MGFFKTVFGGMKDRVKAVDNLTKQINDGDLVVDRKNLEIKKNDEKKTEKKQSAKNYHFTSNKVHSIRVAFIFSNLYRTATTCVEAVARRVATILN